MPPNQPNPWLYRVRDDARLRLFCLPFAGGGSAAFAPWTSQMPPDVDLCPVLLPGRESRLQEPPLRDMAALVGRLVDGLQGALDRPYALLGYSLGSTVAFELIRELRRRERPLPVRLFVASRHAPHYSEQAAIAHLPDDAFVAALQARYNAIPAPILADRELMAMFLPILRADFTLLEGYRCEPAAPLPTPITAWYGADDRTLTRERVAAWATHSAAPFELHEVPAAGHFFHADPRLVRGVAQHLR
jgi:medium-chain acyl-[acyl-carrier-protein] hydrolase